MKNPEPKTQYILFSDYVSMLALIAPIVSWGFYIAAISGIGAESRSGDVVAFDPQVTLAVAAVLTVLGAAIAVTRVRGIRRVFTEGVRVTGVITKVNFERDRGRAEYRFTHDGREIETGAALHKNERSAKLAEGQEVELVVDPRDPSRAFIVSLYS